jgi:integrase
VEKRGALELASKTLIISGQVFRYAIATGRANRDPSRDLRGALQTREVKHYNALKESELPEFLEKLDTYDGSKITKLAIRLLMLTFVRTGELRAAIWKEVSTDKAEWRIPAERMKMGQEHIVPLSKQALEVLEQLRDVVGEREHLFPNEHNPKKCMSENTILFALYRMGYRGRATGHGFRATASTVLNEQGWRADAIERQLAHSEKNKIRAAYHRSEYLPERRKMMQAWAEYLDGLRRGAPVVPLGEMQAA